MSLRTSVRLRRCSVSELELRLRRELRIARINGETVTLCPFCEKAGITLEAEGYTCAGCRARGSLETLTIYVPVEGTQR
jgi:hypothetical protein